MRREGDRLVIEPVRECEPSLAEWLATLDPLDEEFPDVDEGLLPPDDVAEILATRTAGRIRHVVSRVRVLPFVGPADGQS